jgi:hypothetical protein
MVLGPDHPKMARFQAALKDHLKRQINAADLEIRQMDNELKMRKLVSLSQITKKEYLLLKKCFFFNLGKREQI